MYALLHLNLEEKGEYVTTVLAVSENLERLKLRAAVEVAGNDVDPDDEVKEVEAGNTEAPRLLDWFDWSASNDDSDVWLVAAPHDTVMDFERYDIESVEVL